MINYDEETVFENDLGFEEDIDHSADGEYEEEYEEALRGAGSKDLTEGLAADDSIKLYLKEIGRIPLLSPKEERELAERVQRGDADAYNLLWESNLRLVVAVAKKYYKPNKGMDLLDLIQDGNLGLSRAIKNFDSSKNCKFSTYAWFWIRQSITRGLAENGRCIRIPVHKHEEISKQLKAARQLQQELGREPSLKEIADAMETDVETVSGLIEIAQDPSSLDAFVGDEEDTTIGDFVPADMDSLDNSVAFSFLGEELEKALSTLSSREADILRLRFGLDGGEVFSLEDIGKMYNITRERVRQLEANALKKLKYGKDTRHLKDYLAA